MKITKYGHCCLLIEDKRKRILTDPGDLNELPADVSGIDLLIITHEHGDHYHVPSVKEILKQSPNITVVTNNAVGKLLRKEGVTATIITNGQEQEVLDVHLSAHGEKHALVYEGITPPENTGYMINNRLFYPGDAFTNPKMPIEILALPVAAPWLSMREAIDYAREVKPKLAFPVHDGMINNIAPYHFVPGQILPNYGIEFKPLQAGESLEV